MTIRLKVLDGRIRLVANDGEYKLKNPSTIIYQTEGEGQIYSGPYFVVPKINDDVLLSTKSKVMKEDIRVSKIPQFEVSNESGGKTLILGDDYYNG